MKKLMIVTALIAALIALTACTSEKNTTAAEAAELATTELFAMDTLAQLRAYGPYGEAGLEKAKQKIALLESLWSHTSPTSEIARLNAPADPDADPDAVRSEPVSKDTIALLEAAKALSVATNRAFDVTVYPLTDAWGFTSGEYRVPDDDELAALVRRVGSDKIVIFGDTVRPADNMQFDLGAIARGYASEAAAEALRDAGVNSAVISLGGNVRVLGTKPDGTPWNIAISDPFEPDAYLGTVKVTDCAVVTSASTSRSFELDGVMYHHILNPATGYPADGGLVSVTIIAPDGTTADALATAAVVLGHSGAIDLWRDGEFEFEMILVDTSGIVYVTDGLAETFSTAESPVIIPRLP